MSASRKPSTIPGRSSRDLADLYPTFRRRIDDLLAELHRLGHRPVVRETWRSPSRQAYYLERGWSQVSKSFHTVTGPEGRPEALAIDLHDGRWEPDSDRQLELYRALVQLAPKYDLESGGSWSRRADSKWSAFDLGWDPGHLEPRNMTIAAAHAGARPWTEDNA